MYKLYIFILLATVANYSWSAPVASNGEASKLDVSGLARFEQKAQLAKSLGATHVLITEDLPPATWEFDYPDDPYPGWFIQRPDLLKIFPPKEVQPYIDMDYTRRVAGLLEERSRILQRLGLKAHWASNIPQVLPEAFFTAYPQLRGPRVDQPNRSRTPRWSLCVDQPESLRLYREAMQSLLTKCPAVETFSFLTQDSGSGFCWVPALYPGINGNSECKDRPMADRIVGFMLALRDGAKAAGREIEISLNPISPRQWMLPSFSPEQVDAIVHRLPRGYALKGREGSDGRPYDGFTAEAYVHGGFYPVVGIPVPEMNFSSSRGARAAKAADGATPRLMIRFGAQDALLDFSARFYRATHEQHPQNQIEHLQMLRNFAVSEVGEKSADDLLQAWTLLEQAQRGLAPLDFGDMLQFGHVLNRWINRPMVPFPENLPASDKAYYKKFLFQAKGDEQADNLIDIQAMRMFDGFGAHLLFQHTVELVIPQIDQALRRINRIRDNAADEAKRNEYNLIHLRLEASICLLHSADNMVAYQAQLDRVKSLGIKPEQNPVLGVQSSWDRTDLMETARKEIDNAAHLQRILKSATEPIIDLAPVAAEETMMRLGPSVADQLTLKINIMNAHWTDYDRLFTKPNP